MPIYEYQCQACQHELEVLQKLSDDPISNCPNCGKSTLKKKISAAGFRLKGGGWYETDFKTGSKKNIAGGAESASGGDVKAKATANTPSPGTSAGSTAASSNG